jgi:hypothetical protein
MGKVPAAGGGSAAVAGPPAGAGVATARAVRGRWIGLGAVTTISGIGVACACAARVAPTHDKATEVHSNAAQSTRGMVLIPFPNPPHLIWLRAAASADGVAGCLTTAAFATHARLSGSRRSSGLWKELS